jgi:sn-glycerol 3-phosphate transport system permease protein
MLPVIYCLMVAFMRADEILTTSFHFFPKSFYLGNFITALAQTKLPRYLINSFIVAFGSSVVRIAVCALAAYSFAFFSFKGKNFLFFLVLGSMVIPPDVLIIQNYFTVAGMNLINTYTGMMIIYFVSAQNIFVIRQYFKSYSVSLKEAAMIDGCGNMRFFLRILLPSTTPVLLTVFISSFIGTWNTYLWPLLVTNVNEMRTAQVAITMLNVSDTNPFGPVMAASILILLPAIVVFVVFQKRIVSGMMAGAVKG